MIRLQFLFLAALAVFADGCNRAPADSPATDGIVDEVVQPTNPPSMSVDVLVSLPAQTKVKVDFGVFAYPPLANKFGVNDFWNEGASRKATMEVGAAGADAVAGLIEFQKAERRAEDGSVGVLGAENAYVFTPTSKTSAAYQPSSTAAQNIRALHKQVGQNGARNFIQLAGVPFISDSTNRDGADLWPATPEQVLSAPERKFNPSSNWYRLPKTDQDKMAFIAELVALAKNVDGVESKLGGDTTWALWQEMGRTVGIPGGKRADGTVNYGQAIQSDYRSKSEGVVGADGFDFDESTLKCVDESGKPDVDSDCVERLNANYFVEKMWLPFAKAIKKSVSTDAKVAAFQLNSTNATGANRAPGNTILATSLDHLDAIVDGRELVDVYSVQAYKAENPTILQNTRFALRSSRGTRYARVPIVYNEWDFGLVDKSPDGKPLSKTEQRARQYHRGSAQVVSTLNHLRELWLEPDLTGVYFGADAYTEQWKLRRLVDLMAQMPEKRSRVTVEGPARIESIASGSDERAVVVFWNADDAKAVVDLSHMNQPVKGTMQQPLLQYRIFGLDFAPNDSQRAQWKPGPEVELPADTMENDVQSVNNIQLEPFEVKALFIYRKAKGADPLNLNLPFAGAPSPLRAAYLRRTDAYYPREVRVGASGQLQTRVDAIGHFNRRDSSLVVASADPNNAAVSSVTLALDGQRLSSKEKESYALQLKLDASISAGAAGAIFFRVDYLKPDSQEALKTQYFRFTDNVNQNEDTVRQLRETAGWYPPSDKSQETVLAKLSKMTAVQIDIGKNAPASGIDRFRVSLMMKGFEGQSYVRASLAD